MNLGVYEMFAYLPTRMTRGGWVWLKPYYELRSVRHGYVLKRSRSYTDCLGPLG